VTGATTINPAFYLRGAVRPRRLSTPLCVLFFPALPSPSLPPILDDCWRVLDGSVHRPDGFPAERKRSEKEAALTREMRKREKERERELDYPFDRVGRTDAHLLASALRIGIRATAVSRSASINIASKFNTDREVTSEQSAIGAVSRAVTSLQISLAFPTRGGGGRGRAEGRRENRVATRIPRSPRVSKWSLGRSKGRLRSRGDLDAIVSRSVRHRSRGNLIALYAHTETFVDPESSEHRIAGTPA